MSTGDRDDNQDRSAEWHDAKTRLGAIAGTDRLADILLGMWDKGGRGEMLTLLKATEPLNGMAAVAVLSGLLFERNVMDWSDLVEWLNTAR